MRHCRSLSPLFPYVLLLSGVNVVVVVVDCFLIASSTSSSPSCLLQTAIARSNMRPTILPSRVLGPRVIRYGLHQRVASSPSTLRRPPVGENAIASLFFASYHCAGRSAQRQQTPLSVHPITSTATAGVPPANATTTIALSSRGGARATSPSRDTIFALSTGNSGPAGIAVVRISGEGSASVLEAITASSAHDSTAGGEGPGKGKGKLPAPRRAVVRRLYDPVTGDLLDEALVLWMPGPRR